MKAIIKKETLQFLKDIKKNNDRDWFNKNKEKYVASSENFLEYVAGMIGAISKFDKSVASVEPRDCVFRIYRDTRFAKDKTPYKTFFGAHMMGKQQGCGIAGYYFHFEPGNSFLAGGVHATEPAQMRAIREEISEKGKDFLKIINDKNFKEHFRIEGEKLQNVPKGFDKEDPMGDYLKFKELMIHHSVADKEITGEGFVEYSAGIFKAMVPFNAFVNKPVFNLK